MYFIYLLKKSECNLVKSSLILIGQLIETITKMEKTKKRMMILRADQQLVPVVRHVFNFS